MNCDTARDRLLEASPAELARSTRPDDDALAAHLAACPACRTVAAVLADELATLDGAMEAYAESGDPDHAAERALAEARAGGDVVVPPVARRPAAPRIPRARRLARLGAGMGLAAAAAAAVLLWPGPTPDGSAPRPAAAPADAAAPRLAVAPPADRSAVVLATENPNITIVWLYDPEES